MAHTYSGGDESKEEVPVCSRCGAALARPGWSSVCENCGYFYGVPPQPMGRRV